ncbi:hypothetical protein PAHAL_6G276600 [Panicum hallii]|uniref:Uncharacterized protein n=1 Tax=Panicum hallii TaxID=206008 RepID=A0A2T8IHU3_9POAL|nr:hypothetical protein PAHAL_6G276600 [Panicum hallii]
MEREHCAPAAAALWGHKHLPLLARAGSKESLEYILQALWRTRRTGLDAADRAVARDALHLASDAELDPVSTPLTPTYLFFPPTPFRAVAVMPSRVSRVQNARSVLNYVLTRPPLQLLVCLRILIRRCVSEDVSKDDIPKLFPDEVPPELQKLLTLLLQKFQPEWQDDASKYQASAPHSGTVECQLNQNGDTAEQPDAPDAALQNGTASVKDSIKPGEKEVKKFPLAKDSLDKMLKDLFSTKDQMPVAGSKNGHEEVAGSTSKV